MYKKGDIVKVWSLQSFHGGGFIDGRVGIVRQNQTGKSVLVILERNVSSLLPNKPNARNAIDSSYEVYEKQIELVKKATKKSVKNVDEFLELNSGIRTYEHDQMLKDNKVYNVPYHYAPEFYIDKKHRIKLDKSLLEYPESFI